MAKTTNNAQTRTWELWASDGLHGEWSWRIWPADLSMSRRPSWRHIRCGFWTNYNAGMAPAYRRTRTDLTRFSFRTMCMIMLLHPKRLVLALITVTALATSAQDTSVSPAMKLIVDETQSARRLAFVHEEIRVRPGTLALAYPRWIPGEHGPTGPIQQLAALRVRSGNLTLPWTRGNLHNSHYSAARRRTDRGGF